MLLRADPSQVKAKMFIRANFKNYTAAGVNGEACPLLLAFSRNLIIV